MNLVEECVKVIHELDEHMDSFDAPRRAVAGHVLLRLEEILGRSAVEILSNDTVFDRARHKPYADHAATFNGAAVRETHSPGFVVGPRVLRRAGAVGMKGDQLEPEESTGNAGCRKLLDRRR